MRVAIPAATALLLAACSRTTPSPRATPSQTSVEGFCAAASVAWCRWKDACNPARAD